LSVETRAGAEALSIDIRQTQTAPSPHFHISIDVEVSWAGGSHRETVRSTGEMVTIRVPGAPADAQVVLDPDGWLLHRRAEGR
jgi:hypothetical protein